MSGIFGLFQRNEEPVAPQKLQAMHDAMAYWGPDGSDIWRDRSVGLGSLLLYNTPESLHERLPRQTPDGQMVLTAEARIDNRAELLRRLTSHPKSAAALPTAS